jgi:hypothetical protein
MIKLQSERSGILRAALALRDKARDSTRYRFLASYRGAGYARVGCSSNILRILIKLRKAPR